MQARILHRIAVAAPYFALDGVEFDGTELRAEASAETETGDELGPMSGAEIARHAVVAGLSAVALGRPDAARCYYLASSIDATYYRNAAAFGTRVRLSARATEQGPVGGAAQVDVRIGHDLLGHAAVSFAVIPESLFERLFARHRAATFDDAGTHRTYPPLDALWHDQKDAHARLPIPCGSCRGHFEQYSALPVTVLAGELVRMASSVHAEPFRVSRLRVRSQALAWAGEELSLSVSRTTGAWNFAGHAAVLGRTIANVQIGLT